VDKLLYFFVESIFSFAGLIPIPRNSTDCVKNQETEKAAKDQQRAVEP
jgi:hypothetical protein